MYEEGEGGGEEGLQEIPGGGLEGLSEEERELASEVLLGLQHRPPPRQPSLESKRAASLQVRATGLRFCCRFSHAPVQAWSLSNWKMSEVHHVNCTCKCCSPDLDLCDFLPVCPQP
jgi:hypothetical protein